MNAALVLTAFLCGLLRIGQPAEESQAAWDQLISRDQTLAVVDRRRRSAPAPPPPCCPAMPGEAVIAAAIEVFRRGGCVTLDAAYVGSIIDSCRGALASEIKRSGDAPVSDQIASRELAAVCAYLLSERYFP